MESKRRLCLIYLFFVIILSGFCVNILAHELYHYFTLKDILLPEIRIYLNLSSEHIAEVPLRESDKVVGDYLTDHEAGMNEILARIIGWVSMILFSYLAVYSAIYIYKTKI